MRAHWRVRAWARASRPALLLTFKCAAVMAKTPAKKAAKEGKKKSGHKKAKKESYGIYIYKVRAGETRGGGGGGSGRLPACAAPPSSRHNRRAPRRC